MSPGGTWSCSDAAGAAGTSLCAPSQVRTALQSTGPSMRKAREMARRRSASSRHASVGCRCAPRPALLPAASGTTARVAPSPSATTRRRSDFAACSRQPTQVRTGDTRLIGTQSTGLDGDAANQTPVRPWSDGQWTVSPAPALPTRTSSDSRASRIRAARRAARSLSAIWRASSSRTAACSRSPPRAKPVA